MYKYDVYVSSVITNITETTCGKPVRDKGQQYNVVSITLGVISAAVLLVRLGYKLFIAHTDLGLDDWFIVATVITGVPTTIITSLGSIPNGLGRDIWTLEPRQITNFIHYFYFMSWLYFLDLALMKTSLLFFYLRIFPKKPIRILLWCTIAFNAVWGVTFALILAFDCQPISYFWTYWDGEHVGTCLNTNAIGWANAAISIAEDIWMLAIPLSQLRSLQLHWKKKVGVAIMFCTGAFVTVISIVRLQSLITFANSSNATWDNLPVSLWSTIEINVGIICACMPTMRLLLLKMFPKLSSTYRNMSGYYAGGATNQSKLKHSRSKTPANDGLTSSRINYSRSYTVQFQDAKASSQVQLNHLGREGFEAKSTVSECSAEDSNQAVI
ncbi:hypothetical protein VP1G_02965 [Cytospora mali]|uniref:Rhodopsin domain-containing protein n=1 Tax=Cytospora mali TaxID=578113 RepID=A0A194UV47_CYTMA|nr:hypothetical protein VP1G_02965 [Valsa mali var. pyri (nom. inval.)]